MHTCFLDSELPVCLLGLECGVCAPLSQAVQSEGVIERSVPNSTVKAQRLAWNQQGGRGVIAKWQVFI